jgi:hypothetical protein
MPPGDPPPAAGRIRIAGATVPGATHLRRGKPNQDAVGWLPASGEGERLVMAVSDGHGGSSSPRSHIGSRLAVDVATKVLWRLPANVTEDLLREAVQRLTEEWKTQIRLHLERNPLSTAELDEGCADSAADLLHRLQATPTVAYGATLLFAALDARHVCLGQLGDGDVLLVRNDGRVVRPLPADERLVAHVTTSLCDDDPVGNTRLAVLPLDSSLVILATDGYGNSFVDDDSFVQVGNDLLAAVVETGITGVRQSLPRWLEETSRQGAGDDISVAVALTPAALARARTESASSSRASRPAVRPVTMHPVRPLNPNTAQGAPAGGGLTVKAEPLPELLTVETAALPTDAREASPSVRRSRPSGPPAPPYDHPPAPSSWGRTPPRGAIVLVAGLAALLGVAIVGYLALGDRGFHGGSVSSQPRATSSPTSQLTPTATPTMSVPSWSLHEQRRIVVRQNGTGSTKLVLPSPIRDFRVVHGGALLFLLADGQVGRLPEAGPLSVRVWPKVDQTCTFDQEGTAYYLEVNAVRRWTIDSLTGEVTPLAKEGSERVPPSPTTSVLPPPANPGQSTATPSPPLKPSPPNVAGTVQTVARVVSAHP